MWDASTTISAIALAASIVGYIALTVAFVVRTRSMGELVDARLTLIQEQWLREMGNMRREFGEHLEVIRRELHTLNMRSDQYHALSSKVDVLQERLRMAEGERKQ